MLVSPAHAYFGRARQGSLRPHDAFGDLALWPAAESALRERRLSPTCRLALHHGDQPSGGETVSSRGA
jgi:hypothetical protein